MPDLLVEIGVEELPPSFVEPALEQLWAGLWERLLAARLLPEGVRVLEQLGGGELGRWATPRRLVVVVRVAGRQADAVTEVRGPSVKSAFGPDGRPTRAAEGFAKSGGVTVEDLLRRTTPQGEYLFAVRREPGRPAREVLPDVIAGALASLAFLKTMRWNGAGVRFARPIRWIVALLDGEVLPVEYAGVRAGRLTWGHRFLAPGPFAVEAPEALPAVLERAYVVLDPARRRAIIESGLREQAAAAGGRAVLDPALLDESTYLVEWPTAFAGRFDPEFLSLPREVLITVMQHHQKYFAVEDERGDLLPAFLALRNGTADGIDTVREGNEWVLRARLADARFFYEEDRRTPLADRVGALAEVAFLDGLGTMLDKVRRLRVLVTWIGHALDLSDDDLAHVDRAALLCKADLVTQMVGEFPELQGVMGGEYARLDGEAEPVCAAIREHYRPRGTDDPPPTSRPGAVLAIADRLDTLTGALAIGKAPSGSEDPYGLRRAASGVVATILAHGLRLSLSEAVDQAQMGHPLPMKARRQAMDAALDLLRSRLRAALEADLPRDVVDAALAAGADDAVDARVRARAVAAVRSAPEFARLATAYDRASRILAGVEAPEDVDPARFEDPAEVALRDAAGRISPSVAALAEAGRYEEALRALLAFAEPVDRFFDAVLVMAPDPGVRANRLALLRRVVDAFRRVADLGRVVR